MRSHANSDCEPQSRDLETESGSVAARRLSDVDREEIRALLRTGPLRFVVEDFLGPLRWVPLADCWLFWKNEVKDHLCPDGPIYLNQLPGEYCYRASLWKTATGERIIYLEMFH